MRRVLPFLLLITALEVYGMVWCGKLLFKSHFVEISKVSILDNSCDEDGDHYIIFSYNDQTRTSIMNPTDYRIFFQKKRMVRYINADSHIGLAVLYLITVILLGIYLLIKIPDFFASYYSDRDPGYRFVDYQSILPGFYSELYNNIDAADLTPVKQSIRKFFGYETSSDI
jgi:hypothetical protein